MMRLTWLFLAGAALLAGLVWPVPLVAGSYRLHAQDRVLIRVLIWDFRQNSFIGWQELSGEYSLGPEGLLQLPLAGEIEAEGLTQAELATAISDLLRRRAGLDEAPTLSVELVSSVPVYVLGEVETRGAVPFRPGLSARQALALAGGLHRPVASDPIRVAALAAELRAAGDSLARLRAERAAIEAELAHLGREAGNRSGAPDAPLHLTAETAAAATKTGPVPADAALGAQTRLQQADSTARQVRRESYTKLREVLREKAGRMNRQLELRDRQIAAARKELEGITSLNERGLAVNARVTALSTALSDLESKRLELETALLLLEEQRNQADRDSSTLVADAVVERLQRMTALEGLIAEAELNLESVRTQTALLGTEVAGDAGGKVGFMLTRGGRTTPMTADATLLPGDTLEVIRRQPAFESPEDTDGRS